MFRDLVPNLGHQEVAARKLSRFVDIIVQSLLYSVRNRI